jgi:hypothetical protein
MCSWVSKEGNLLCGVINNRDKFWRYAFISQIFTEHLFSAKLDTRDRAVKDKTSCFHGLCIARETIYMCIK